MVYHFAKFVYVRDLDQMRTAHEAAVRCLDAALPHLDPPGERIEMPFEGSTIYGILRKPAGAAPHPVVIMVPGLDSTKEELRSTEQLFLERGLATFSVDGPGQGEAEYDLPIRPDWEVPGRTFVDALVRATTSTPTASASGGSASAGTTHPDSPAATSGSRRRQPMRPLLFRRKLGCASRSDPRDVHGPVALDRRGRRPRLGADADDGRPHLGLAVPHVGRRG